MTDSPNRPPDDHEAAGPKPEDVYETMEPLEPYTTGELAGILNLPKQLAKKLLDSLTIDEKVRKKEPEPERVIWIREPPAHECPKCGREFEIKYIHPVLSAVQFCPRCGTQLD